MKQLTMKNSIYLAVLAVLSASAVGSVYAARSADNDALAIADAKVGLVPCLTASRKDIPHAAPDNAA